MSVSKFVPVLLNGEPSNPPSQSQITLDSDSKEKSIAELLEERLMKATLHGDLTIFSPDERPIAAIDAYIWNLWKLKPNQAYEDEVVSCTQFEEVTESAIELDISDDAILSLVKFMYTGKFFPDYKAVLEISEKAKELGLHPLIRKAASTLVANDLTLENVINAWQNTLNESNNMSKSFEDLSISFILSCPNVVFRPTEIGEPKIPRELLEYFLPSKLKLNLDCYIKIAEGRWEIKVRDRGDDKIYLEMKHHQLAHFLCRWALNEFKAQGLPSLYPNLLELEQLLGDLIQLLDPVSFDATNPENMDLSVVSPVDQSIGVFYYHMLVTSRSMSLDYKTRYLANECSMLYTNQTRDQGIPTNIGTKRPLHHKGQGLKSILPSLPVKAESSSSVKKSKSDPFTENPVLLLLKEEFEKKLLTNVSITFGESNQCIKTHSFLLSLQSSRMDSYFRNNSNTSWTFELGEAVDGKMVEAFVKLFYVDQLPSGKILEDCLRLSCHLRLSNIMKRTFFEVQRLPISKLNASLKYQYEEQLGEMSRLGQIMGYMKQNLVEIVNEGYIGMFETMEFMMKFLSLPREPTVEYPMIMSIIRWGQYNGYSEEKMRELLSTTFKDLVNLKYLHTSHINSLVSTYKVISYLEGLKFAKEGGEFWAIKRLQGKGKE